MAGSSSSSSAGPATTVWWNPTAIAVAQVDAITVTGVAGNAVLTVTVGIAPFTASLFYLCTNTDTTTTAATNLAAVLNGSSDPRFTEITFSATGPVITCTANNVGVPFTLAVSVSGQAGGGLTLGVNQANVSPSDVANAANWDRSGVQGVPQNGDTVIVADSSVPLLYNLDQLQNVQFGSYTRWQSFTGKIGLPTVNPSGYVEYRPTYFQFTGPPGGNLQLNLGVGQTGSGPTLERYNVGGQQTTMNLYGAGSPSGDFSVYFLGSSAFNVLNIYASSVGVAMLPGESATIQTASVIQGGSLSLGPQCTFTGTLTVSAAKAVVMDSPNSILAQNGATVTVQSTNLTYPSIKAISGSSFSWLSNGNITTLTLQTGSSLDKSRDARPMTVTNATMDGDTTIVTDPWSAISWTNPITFNNAVQSGPVQFGAGRTARIV